MGHTRVRLAEVEAQLQQLNEVLANAQANHEAIDYYALDQRKTRLNERALKLHQNIAKMKQEQAQANYNAIVAEKQKVAVAKPVVAEVDGVPTTVVHGMQVPAGLPEHLAKTMTIKSLFPPFQKAQVEAAAEAQGVDVTTYVMSRVLGKNSVSGMFQTATSAELKRPTEIKLNPDDEKAVRIDQRKEVGGRTATFGKQFGAGKYARVAGAGSNAGVSLKLPKWLIDQLDNEAAMFGTHEVKRADGTVSHQSNVSRSEYIRRIGYGR